MTKTSDYDALRTDWGAFFGLLSNVRRRRSLTLLDWALLHMP
jgi:hypothetical protein